MPAGEPYAAPAPAARRSAHPSAHRKTRAPRGI